MERRQPGETPTLEARHEAEKKVDKNKRYKQIMAILDGSEMTAKEISEEMCRRGYTPTGERNHSAPRLTELSEKGLVEPIGKKKCLWTGRSVTVYALRQ
jgi:repressor of nif and glnA expression